MTTADPTPEPIVVGLWTFTRDGDRVLVDHPAHARGARYHEDYALTALFGEVERLRSKVGPDRDDRPDGALCWDPDGPDGGAWVMRAADVPDGWRWWANPALLPVWGTPPSGDYFLYWALPPEPATERVPWWEVVGRTVILKGEPHEVRSVTWYDDHRVRLGYTTPDQIDHRVDLVHDDGTVEVLRDGDR